MKWHKDDVYKILFNQLRSLYWLSEDEIEIIDGCMIGANQAGKRVRSLGGGSVAEIIGHGVDAWGGGRSTG